MNAMSDDELAREMKAGLERRAAMAEVQDALIAQAQVAARGRRAARWVAVGAAAAVVVAVAVVGSVVARDDGQIDTADVNTPTPTATDPPALAGAVRTEYWRDVAVDVPAEWGFGAAPAGDLGSALTCFPGAAVTAGGGRTNDQSLPYVGRPVALTDVCVPYPDNRPDAPATDYVWLGAAVEPGTVELDNGLVQETVDIGGTPVTVATTDPALRRRILQSVRGGETCLSDIDEAGPLMHDQAPPDSEVVAMNVCVYELSGRRSGLSYATTLGQGAVDAYLDAVAAGDTPRDQCPSIDYDLSQAVLIELVDASGSVVRQDAVNTFESCAGVAVDADRLWVLETTALTPAMAEPWVVEGVPAVVHGSPDLGLIGPQG